MQSTQFITMMPFTIKDVIAGMLSHPNNPDLYRIHVQPADATSGEPTIKYLTAPVWCGTTVDEQDCQDEVDNPDWPNEVVTVDGKEVGVPNPTDLQCMDYVSASVIATPPGAVTAAAGANQVVCVTDWVPGHWVGVEADTRAHETVEARDPGLAPRVVAHVTENHARVVGFLLELVPGAREAGAADLDECRAALARLHALGIAKGELSRHSLLVREDGSVLVQGPFTGCFAGGENIEEVMRVEMASLEDVLSRSPSVFEDHAASVLRLVDPRRKRLLEEFQTAHGLVVPFVYWQDSREGGRRITLTVEQHGVLAEEYKKNGYRWTMELQEQAEKRFGPSVEVV